MRISFLGILFAFFVIPVALAGETTPLAPHWLSIPSIKLEAPVVEVGMNTKGEMDVPDGSTKNVGWYKHGVFPGEMGSAVLDAHVYAAFKNLKHVDTGDDIYVAKGQNRLHFKVVDFEYYTLEELPLEVLFNRNDSKRLNLITCAGRWDQNTQTYTHRLVVYAELVEN